LAFIMVPGPEGERKPFLLGKYEVTQGQYEAGDGGANPSTFKNGPDYPVEQMRLAGNAKDFCAQLNAGLPTIAKMSFRLPTDEEWSIAVGLAGGGARLPQAEIQQDPGLYIRGARTGRPPAPLATTADASEQEKNTPSACHTCRVSMMALPTRRPFGVFPAQQGRDSTTWGGNVWEWCEDFVDEEKEYPRGAWGRLVHAQRESTFCPPTAEFRPNAPISPAASGVKLERGQPVVSIHHFSFPRSPANNRRHCGLLPKHDRDSCCVCAPTGVRRV